MSASDYGIKISLPGYDVASATPEQCSLHSGYPSPKIEVNRAGYTLQGSAVYTFPSNPASPGTTNLLTVNHPYAYAPLAIGTWFYDFGAGNGPEYGSFPLVLGVPDIVYAYATATQFKLDIVRAGGGVNLTGAAFTYRYTITCENGA